MRCPYCGSKQSRVVDKRDGNDDGNTRRRRECLKCYKRFTTYERIENVELDVLKKDGTIEKFNRDKIIRSLNKAISKRPISDDQVLKLVEDIEMKLLNRKASVIKSSEIGKMILNRLKWLDGVAYMRFASVYKDFEDLDDFQTELNLLREYYAQERKRHQ